MKRWLILLLVALATPAGAWTTVLEDPPGDVTVRLAEQTEQTDPADRSSPTDVLSLEVEEDLEAFRFRVQNSGWTTGPQAMVVDEGRYWILWTYGDVEYGAMFRRVQADSGPQMDALLHRIENGVPERLGELSFELEDDAVVVEVPRLSIIDSRGASPRPGEALAGVEVLSFGAATGYLSNGDDVRGQGDEAVIRSYDFMGPPTAWAVQEGVRQDGDLELWSPDPMRVSNGAASAFVFDVRLTSHGDARLATLAASEVPRGWSVTLPFHVVEVPAGGQVLVPVIVSIPFAHAHGSRDVFLLTATDGGHVGRLEVGVVFTDIPQPAGHHDALYIHTDRGPAISFEPAFGALYGGDVRARAFMNTLHQDPTDEDVRVPSNGITYAGYENTVTWSVLLRPGLAMGLDLADATGAIEVPFEYDYLATDLRLSGELQVADETVAVLRSGPAKDVTRDRVTLEATIEPKADRIAYAKGNDLWLRLAVTGTFNGPYPGPDTAVHLVSGGWLQLPLEEYQDAPETLQTSDIALSFDTARASANPGDAVLFRLSIASAEPRTVSVNVAGQHADWARVQQERIKVDGSREVMLAVGVPDDAIVGDVADLVVSVADVRDPSVRSIGRVTVAVTDVPIDSDPEAEAMLGTASSAKSPAPAWMVLAAALALAMARRRASAP